MAHNLSWGPDILSYLDDESLGLFGYLSAVAAAAAGPCVCSSTVGAGCAAAEQALCSESRVFSTSQKIMDFGWRYIVVLRIFY